MRILTKRIILKNIILSVAQLRSNVFIIPMLSFQIGLRCKLRKVFSHIQTFYLLSKKKKKTNRVFEAEVLVSQAQVV